MTPNAVDYFHSPADAHLIIYDLLGLPPWVQLAPDNAEAWMRLGSCRFQLEQFAAAIRPLRRTTQLLTPAGTPANTHLQDALWLLVQVCRLPHML